ncbi:MAG: alpha/beta hydrolase [bacterium]
MSKTNLILVTGWSFGPNSLRHLAAAIPDCETHVLNHGPLAAKGPIASLFPCSNLARGLITMLDQCTEPCWLGGWSMGGMIALEAARQMPRLVKGLILINTTAKFCSDDYYVHGVPTFELQSMARRFKKDHRTALRRFYAAAARPFGPDIAYVPEWTETMQNGLTYLEKTDLRKTAQQIELPALVLHGQDDAVIPVTGGEFLAKLLKNSKTKTYYGVGHDLPLRKPKVVAKEIATFMQAHP